jgi:hypothetical protein
LDGVIVATVLCAQQVVSPRKYKTEACLFYKQLRVILKTQRENKPEAHKM